jgi:serine/threonine protein kinase
MKAENLLLTRNYMVKIGDFGISIKLNKKQKKFELKGLTMGMGLPEVDEGFKMSMAGNQN